MDIGAFNRFYEEALETLHLQEVTHGQKILLIRNRLSPFSSPDIISEIIEKPRGTIKGIEGEFRAIIPVNGRVVPFLANGLSKRFGIKSQVTVDPNHF